MFNNEFILKNNLDWNLISSDIYKKKKKTPLRFYHVYGKNLCSQIYRSDTARPFCY